MTSRGPKTREWEAVRRKLKAGFQRANITTCEFVYLGCWYDNGLSFAHAKKRRELRPGELSVVALACTSCHGKLERMQREIMFKRVMGAIKRRQVQPY